MPAKDQFHEMVKIALIKDGWTITDDPLKLQYAGIDLYIDLGAERVIAAERNEELIAIEIKIFLGSSLTSEFHTALGQFLNYKMALEAREPTRKLYLAVPKDIYETFFFIPFISLSVKQYGVNIVVYNPKKEVIEKWID